jgi:hypothetical protein
LERKGERVSKKFKEGEELIIGDETLPENEKYRKRKTG